MKACVHELNAGGFLLQRNAQRGLNILRQSVFQRIEVESASDQAKVELCVSPQLFAFAGSVIGIRFRE